MRLAVPKTQPFWQGEARRDEAEGSHCCNSAYIYFSLCWNSLRDEVLGSGDLKSVGDRIVTLQRLAANSHSRGALIPYLRDNAQALIAALQPSSISSAVSTLSTYVGTQEELDSVRIRHD